MNGPDRKKSGWLLVRVWLNAIEETAREFHGTLPKEFCTRAYEHATDSWMKILEDEHGIYIPKADTLKNAIQNYIQASIAGGLFDDAGKFELEELSDGSVKIRVFSCPYQESCQDLLKNSNIALKTLTCARIGCFRAAAWLLTSIDCKYEVTDIRPGKNCIGFVKPVLS